MVRLPDGPVSSIVSRSVKMGGMPVALAGVPLIEQTSGPPYSLLGVGIVYVLAVLVSLSYDIF